MAKQGFGVHSKVSLPMAANRTISRVLGYSLAKAGVDILHQVRWAMGTSLLNSVTKIRVNANCSWRFSSASGIEDLLTNEDGYIYDRGGKT